MPHIQETPESRQVILYTILRALDQFLKRGVLQNRLEFVDPQRANIQEMEKWL